VSLTVIINYLHLFSVPRIRQLSVRCGEELANNEAQKQLPPFDAYLPKQGQMGSQTTQREDQLIHGWVGQKRLSNPPEMRSRARMAI